MILSEKRDIVTVEAHDELSGETLDQGFIWFGSKRMIKVRGRGLDIVEGDVGVGEVDEKKEVVREGGGGGGGVVGEAEHGGVAHREVFSFFRFVMGKDKHKHEDNR